MVRLPEAHLESFERLTGEFGGLQPATILKMIAMSFLEEPYSEQVRRIDQQVRKPKKKSDDVRANPSHNSRRDLTKLKH